MAKSAKNVPAKPAGSALGPLGALLTGIFGPLTWENLNGWIKIIALILIIRWIWFEPFRIPSSSMEPTLHGDPRFFHGDRVAVNKWIYGVRVPFMNERFFDLQKPKRFDIAVFRNVEVNPQNKILIKRIMGLPGERIAIRDGKVHVNGEPVKMPDDLKEIYYTQGSPYAQSEYKFGLLPVEQFSVVPDDHYLMLGDNSADSRDGRVFGWVPRDNLIGPVFCTWWPFGRMRDFTGWSHTWWGMLILYGIPGTVIVYEVARSFFVASWRVRAGIVAGGLKAGEHILINRLAFGLRAPFSHKRLTPGRRPYRNELVVFHAPESSPVPGAVLVGQVKGFPGDRVRVDNGSIYVDDDAVGDSRQPKPESPNALVMAPADWVSQKEPKIPKRHYLVLADGTEETLDSRVVGWIPHENLVGVVRRVWWPLTRARSLTELATGSIKRKPRSKS